MDFEHCEIRRGLDHLLQAGRRYIRFHAPEFPEEGLSLETWTDRVFRGK